MFAAAYALGTPPLSDGTAWLFYFCFTLSWGLLVSICVLHEGKRLYRTAWGACITIFFGIVAVCHYREPDKVADLETEIQNYQEQDARRARERDAMEIKAAGSTHPSDEILGYYATKTDPDPPSGNDAANFDKANADYDSEKNKSNALNLQNQRGAQEAEKAAAEIYFPQCDHVIKTFISHLQAFAKLHHDTVVESYQGMPATLPPIPVILISPISLKAHPKWIFTGRITFSPINCDLNITCGKVAPHDYDFVLAEFQMNPIPNPPGGESFRAALSSNDVPITERTCTDKDFYKYTSEIVDQFIVAQSRRDPITLP
jgi:hypothetical protein